MQLPGEDAASDSNRLQTFLAAGALLVFTGNTRAHFQVKLSFPAPAAPYLKEGRLILRNRYALIVAIPAGTGLILLLCTGVFPFVGPSELDQAY